MQTRNNEESVEGLSGSHLATKQGLFLCRMPRDGEQVRPLPGVMSPRFSIALMVLRLADMARITSLSFNRRRMGYRRGNQFQAGIRLGCAIAGLVLSR